MVVIVHLIFLKKNGEEIIEVEENRFEIALKSMTRELTKIKKDKETQRL